MKKRWWICDDECQFWLSRGGPKNIHGWCKKYKRFVDPAAVCCCDPIDRVKYDTKTRS